MKVRWGVAVRYPPVRARPRAHLYSSLPSDFTTYSSSSISQFFWHPTIPPSSRTTLVISTIESHGLVYLNLITLSITRLRAGRSVSSTRSTCTTRVGTQAHERSGKRRRRSLSGLCRRTRGEWGSPRHHRLEKRAPDRKRVSPPYAKNSGFSSMPWDDSRNAFSFTAGGRGRCSETESFEEPGPSSLSKYRLYVKVTRWPDMTGATLCSTSLKNAT